MTRISNYVLAGGRNNNPAKLSVRMDPVKLSANMGIALKSIAYGEIYNINETNNKFKIRITDNTATPREEVYVNTITSEDFGFRIVDNSSDNPTDNEITITISPGMYQRTPEVVSKIIVGINTILAKTGLKEQCNSSNMYGVIICDLPRIIEIIDENKDTPLTLINAEYSKFDSTIRVEGGEVPNPIVMTFVYLSIIQNSFINGRKSRLLCVCPLKPEKGYSFIEFANPSYVPIEVQEFSNITITLRDMNGQLVGMSNKTDTIFTLHMKEITDSINTVE